MGGKRKSVAARETIAVRPGVELRTWRMSDARRLFRCVDKNRDHLREWMPWLDITTNIGELEIFLQSCVDGYRDRSCYRVGIWVDGDLSGVVSLEQIDSMHRQAMIGYWLSKDQQGKGLMTAAVHSLVAYAFDVRGLQTVRLTAAANNLRSRAVAERIGMFYEGQLRQREWLYDHYVDHASYSLLAGEWMAEQ